MSRGGAAGTPSNRPPHGTACLLPASELATIDPFMRFLSRFFATTAIRIHNGKASCIKGKMMSRMLNDLSSLCQDQGIRDGEIWINQIGKPSFSKSIPNSAHQRIRNVLST